MFINLHDAKMRLEHTLIRYKKEPVYIIDITQPSVTYFLMVEGLRTDKISKVKLQDPEIDLSPVPLGNLNHEGDTYYTSRIPQRAWKQGLHRDSFIAYSIKHGYCGLPLPCKALLKTIANNYPSVKQSHRLIEEGTVVSSAFSRNFSIGDKRVIVYQSKILIGVFTNNLKDFELDEAHFYFKEHLQASI